ncbi:hypothetical protein YC2023_100622 [Brassica napus]
MPLLKAHAPALSHETAAGASLPLFTCSTAEGQQQHHNQNSQELPSNGTGTPFDLNHSFSTKKSFIRTVMHLQKSAIVKYINSRFR